jgi:hypothetical protein
VRARQRNIDGQAHYFVEYSFSVCELFSSLLDFLLDDFVCVRKVVIEDLCDELFYFLLAYSHLC